MRARYVLIEVYDFHSSNGATISEIEIYDSSNKKISYSPIDVYDSQTGSLPGYWNSSIWGKSKLNDDNISYTDNWAGANSATLFLWGGSPNTGKWARFVLDIGSSKNVALIKVWVGSPEGRIPHNIKIFMSNKYDSTNVSGRQDTNLKFIQQLNFTSNDRPVKLYQVDVVNEKCLVINKGAIKTYDAGWITLNSQEITKELMDSSGIPDLSELDRKVTVLNDSMIKSKPKIFNTTINLNMVQNISFIKVN